MREYYDTYENKKYDTIGCLEGETISKYMWMKKIYLLL
jgi:hypothetical protein